MTKLVIDADTGVDDSIALLYALRCPTAKVLGITTGFGNTSAENAALNSLRMVELANPGYSVPVAKGASCALNGEQGAFPAHIHGENGIANVVLPAPKTQVVEQNSAAFIAEIARRNPGEVTLVTLGRMTNLAQALVLEPGLPQLLRKVVAMGGALAAGGNVSPVAEANIAGDPEAADRVFKAGFSICMVGLDVTMQTRLPRKTLEQVAAYATSSPQREMVQYVQQATKPYMEYYRRQNYFIDEMPLHDPLAVLIALHPDLGQYQSWPARVELAGYYTRGMIVADRRVKPFDVPVVDFCVQVDTRRAVSQLMSVFMNVEQ